MSGFRRRVSRSLIMGTKTSPQTGQIITGSGNPALDELLGGGIPMNAIVLIEEDKHCVYSKVLCKYFLAEGVVHYHHIFLGSLDDNPEDILKKLPEPSFAISHEPKGPESSEEFKQLSQDTTSLRIAWRYNDLPYFNIPKSSENRKHHFNLLNVMSQDKLDAVSKVLWNGTCSNEKKSDESEMAVNALVEEDEEEEEYDEDTNNATDASHVFKNKLFQNLINSVAKKLQRVNFTRICIPSLGSPLWYDENFSEDLLKFLTILRAFVQNNQCVCFLTMPMHLISKSDESLVPKIRNLVDYAIELESFAGSERETNPAFKDYNGLLHFRKMSAINSLALFQHSDLAFKLRRKIFVIEKFHLPPELEVSNEQDSQSTSVSCGNQKSNNLLF